MDYHGLPFNSTIAQKGKVNTIMLKVKAALSPHPQVNAENVIRGRWCLYSWLHKNKIDYVYM